MKIIEREKIFLLETARESIRNSISSSGFRYEPSLQNIISIDRPTVLENIGAFVTVYKDNKLRGCMGRINPSYPLYLVVRDMAIESAIKDKRFLPVTFQEFNDIIIEVSVLTPLKKIESIDELELGHHGVYMVKNGRTGTFLPRVARQNPVWTKEDFVGNCVEEKMDLPFDDWKDCELFTYETITFNEKQYGLI